jgi:hypothetical protein
MNCPYIGMLSVVQLIEKRCKVGAKHRQNTHAPTSLIYVQARKKVLSSQLAAVRCSISAIAVWVRG